MNINFRRVSLSKGVSSFPSTVQRSSVQRSQLPVQHTATQPKGSSYLAFLNKNPDPFGFFADLCSDPSSSKGDSSQLKLFEDLDQSPKFTLSPLKIRKQTRRQTTGDSDSKPKTLPLSELSPQRRTQQSPDRQRTPLKSPPFSPLGNKTPSGKEAQGLSTPVRTPLKKASDTSADMELFDTPKTPTQKELESPSTPKFQIIGKRFGTPTSPSPEKKGGETLHLSLIESPKESPVQRRQAFTTAKKPPSSKIAYQMRSQALKGPNDTEVVTKIRNNQVLEINGQSFHLVKISKDGEGQFHDVYSFNMSDSGRYVVKILQKHHAIHGERATPFQTKMFENAINDQALLKSGGFPVADILNTKTAVQDRCLIMPFYIKLDSRVDNIRNIGITLWQQLFKFWQTTGHIILPDLKPDNIFKNNFNQPLLADFREIALDQDDISSTLVNLIDHWGSMTKYTLFKQQDVNELLKSLESLKGKTPQNTQFFDSVIASVCETFNERSKPQTQTDPLSFLLPQLSAFKG